MFDKDIRFQTRMVVSIRHTMRVSLANMLVSKHKSRTKVTKKCGQSYSNAIRPNYLNFKKTRKKL